MIGGHVRECVHGAPRRRRPGQPADNKRRNASVVAHRGNVGERLLGDGGPIWRGRGSSEGRGTRRRSAPAGPSYGRARGTISSFIPRPRRRFPGADEIPRASRIESGGPGGACAARARAAAARASSVERGGPLGEDRSVDRRDGMVSVFITLTLFSKPPLGFPSRSKRKRSKLLPVPIPRSYVVIDHRGRRKASRSMVEPRSVSVASRRARGIFTNVAAA